MSPCLTPWWTFIFDCAVAAHASHFVGRAMVEGRPPMKVSKPHPVMQRILDIFSSRTPAGLIILTTDRPPWHGCNGIGPDITCCPIQCVRFCAIGVVCSLKFGSFYFSLLTASLAANRDRPSIIDIAWANHKPVIIFNAAASTSNGIHDP